MTKMMSTITKTMATMNSDDDDGDEYDGDKGVLTTLMVTVMMAMATPMLVTKARQRKS